MVVLRGIPAGNGEALAHGTRKDDVYLVWFDGEEAIAQWTDDDSLYGSGIWPASGRRMARFRASKR
jgi:hypothetical protein